MCSELVTNGKEQEAKGLYIRQQLKLNDFSEINIEIPKKIE